VRRKKPVVLCGAALKRIGVVATCGLEAGHEDDRHYDKEQRVTWNSRIAVRLELSKQNIEKSAKQNDSNLGDK